MTIDPHATLGEIVVAMPRAAALFERLRLDYCCGGAMTLVEACERRRLDATTVATVLDALALTPQDPAPEGAHDVARASIAELCDHIVVRHHGPLRPALDRITHLLATVVRVHGKEHPSLLDLERVFAGARKELEEHMRVEEQQLFPACRELDDGDADGLDASLLPLLEDDHAATGDALSAMRELTGGFDDDQALCSTHRALMGALREFEVDLHRHVHEENNILFPRVRERVAA